MLEFEQEVYINNHLMKVWVEAEGHWQCETDYGSDIDGNRGVEKWSLETVKFKVFDQRCNDITFKLIAKKEEFERLSASIFEYVKENDFDGGL